MDCRWCFLLFTFIISSSLPKITPALTPCYFPALFNFGDSNSDTGGLSAAFGQAGYPNGETFFNTPAGRYCDGRLIVDFIAEGFGLPYLSAYLDAVGANFTQGVNFATAGSLIRPQSTAPRQGGFSPFSLDVQLVQFQQFLNRSQLFRSKEEVFKTLLPSAEIFSRALYTIDIGQNDLTAGYYSNMTKEQVEAYVPDLVSRFSNTVKSIYGEGGRFFLLHNTGPVGCLAYMLDRLIHQGAQLDGAGCAKEINEVARFFNVKLKEAVIQLRKDLAAAAIIYVDIYSLKYSFFSDPKKHGFEDPLQTCCGQGGKYNFNNNLRCGGKIMVQGKEIMARSCKNPSVKVCWDGVHYTEAANKKIYEQIVKGLVSDPPLRLNMICHAAR